uniref:Uncharacterized protein n=1 Tax=Arundo donax TaxID=35708 RepID=A0A0A9DSK6_ARUDO
MVDQAPLWIYQRFHSTLWISTKVIPHSIRVPWSTFMEFDGHSSEQQIWCGILYSSWVTFCCLLRCCS